MRGDAETAGGSTPETKADRAEQVRKECDTDIEKLERAEEVATSKIIAASDEGRPTAELSRERDAIQLRLVSRRQDRGLLRVAEVKARRAVERAQHQARAEGFAHALAANDADLEAPLRALMPAWTRRQQLDREIGAWRAELAASRRRDPDAPAIPMPAGSLTANVYDLVGRAVEELGTLDVRRFKAQHPDPPPERIGRGYLIAGDGPVARAQREGLAAGKKPEARTRY